MADRPYTVLSCCTSIDGYLDDTSDTRLVMSTRADLDRVDEVRSQSDAILVGAQTVRSDNPRLLVRSDERRGRRVAEGRSADPVKVTVTRTGDLDPTAAFFTTGEGERLVYAPTDAVPTLCGRIGTAATVVDAGANPTMSVVSCDLHARGVRRLMVEGGASVHGQFIAEELADELHLVVAPLFIGDGGAARFAGSGLLLAAPRPATLAEIRRIDDSVLLQYALSSRFAPADLTLHQGEPI